MSPATRERILDTILVQQAALEVAIERGDVGLQVYIARRMAALETAMEADHEQRA